MDLQLGKIVVLHQITGMNFKMNVSEKINTIILEIVIIDLKDCNNMNSKVIIEAVPLITMMNLEMFGMITDHILEKVILISLEALLMVKEIVIDLFEALVIETMM